ncbi:hypothetical protein BDV18DRAFT_137423 [Aspergillus unguis]
MPALIANPSSLSPALTGTCLCGSIHITIKDPSLWDSRRGNRPCPCANANCRKMVGSYAMSSLTIEEEKVDIRDRRRTLKMYSDLDMMSGRQVERFFCSECGCPVKSTSVLLPGRVILRMGMFSRVTPPEWEAFALRRNPSQGKQESAVQWRIRAGEEVL